MVLYFTGTGNSRYLARRIAEGLEMPLYDLNACIKAENTAPVQTGAERIWFVMDCGSEIGNAAGYNRKLAAQKQLRNPDRGKKGTDAVDSAQPEVVERTRIDLLEKDILPSSGRQKRTFRRL